MSDDHSLARRLEFLKLDPAALTRLRGLRPLVERELPAALDAFYEQVKRFPEVTRFFSGAEHLGRAKGAQLRHWASISAGEYSNAYADSVRTIGQTHARIGLEPRWYIGGYALIAEQLVGRVLAECWPRRFALNSSAGAGETAAALAALLKAIFLDMDLAISIYIEASEEARNRAEEQRAIAAKEQALAVDALSAGLARLNDGDLTVRLTENLAPEYKKLQDDFNATVERLDETMAAIAVASQEIANAASETSTSTTDLSQRTEEQAAGLEETSAAMEQISVTVKKNAGNAKEANQLAGVTREQADRGGRVVAEAVKAISLIEESSHKVSDIIGVIDEIARQTNLLALNAAVEAARAGEAGRGFAVVASEVRSLAQRSSQAAKDIKDLITTSSGQVQQGVEQVNRAGTSLSEIVESIKKVADVVSEIAAASAEQATGLDEVNKALLQMDEVTQQNSAMVEENAATAKTLEAQSAMMDEKVRSFHTSASRSAPSPSVVSSAPKAVVQARRIAGARRAAGGGRTPPARSARDPGWQEF
jgi:methyl-accepting chemotaxis protein